MPQNETKTRETLGPRRPQESDTAAPTEHQIKTPSQTAWDDPWQETQDAQKTVFTREQYQDALRRATRQIGARITDEINADSEEVERIRAGIREADQGKTRRLRRPGTKSG